MTKNEFLKRFQLRTLLDSTHQYRHHQSLKQAAVLVPLIEKENTLKVVLTKRASHLKHHAGQISFPGGKVEESDLDIIATALREANEEIGVLPEHISVVGKLHPYQTITGFVVTPIVAFLDKRASFNVDVNEVAEIFDVPLYHFLDTSNHQTLDVHHKGKAHQVNFMPYRHYNIWGATAAMLKDLALHLD